MIWRGWSVGWDIFDFQKCDARFEGGLSAVPEWEIGYPAFFGPWY